MIAQQLTSLLEDAKKFREAVVVTKVEIAPSKLMDLLAKGLLAEVQRLAPYSGYTPVSELEVADILKYLHTLVWMRVCHVNQASAEAYRPYRELAKHLEVPALLYQLLISIGEAFDADYSIKFVPEYSIASDVLLAPTEVMAISDLFMSLKSSGFASVTGLPRTTDGELDFMAMCHVDEIVTSYRSVSPVYGFLASFFAQKEFNEITGLMCRVIYGYDTDYELYVRRAISMCSSLPSEVGV